MEHQLENPVRVSTKSPHESLYTWFIEELDSATKKVSPNYVPWGWNLYFDARDLTVIRSLEFEADKTSDVREHIHGRLVPQKTDRRVGASYSFFGTNRKIDSFTLRINELRDHLMKEVPLEAMSPTKWDIKRRVFLKNIDPLIANVPGPTMVPTEKLQEMEAKLAEAHFELDANEQEIANLKKQLPDMELLKDRQAVAELKASYSAPMGTSPPASMKKRRRFERRWTLYAFTIR